MRAPFLGLVSVLFAAFAGLGWRRSAVAAGVFFAGILVALQPSVAKGADIRQGGRVEVAADEVLDDTLIVFGESVVVAGTVRGDVIAFAESVIVSGTVTGNLVTAAETVDIDGIVQGSTMAAGQNVSVGGVLAGQLYAAGESVNLEGGAEIAADALLAGAGVDVAGTVGRDVYVGGERIHVAGSTQRDLVMGGSDLRVGGTASVGRNLKARVMEKDDLTIESGVTVGGSTEVKVDSETTGGRFTQAGFYMWRLAMIAGGVLFGMVVYLLAPGLFRAPTMKRLPRSLAFGLIGIVAIPMAAVAAAMLVVGIPVAMAAMGAYVLAIYVGSLLVAALVGHELLRRRQYRPADIGWSLALGLLLLAIVFEVPYVGPVLGFCVVVLGLGIIIDHGLEAVRGRKKSVVIEPPLVHP